jgi:malonyl CoA-acyl carrier protein transacylase
MKPTISNVDPTNEYATLSVEELQEKLSEFAMKQKALLEQKRLLTKSFNELLKNVKVELGNVLEILEAKDSDTARRVSNEINRR